ncbi:MAG TPA: metallophosphoesterase [Candidatus Limnocylindrales bacterium]|nr:metallophosphoesterase [Candidatus Limnocylindrales bacterium]
MIRRATVEWPSAAPFRDRGGRPIRFLAVSDEREPALEIARNRELLVPLDGVIGCGDLDPRWLAFLGDAFAAPLIYVRGNHDRGGDWDERRLVVPDPLRSGSEVHLAGLRIAAFEWPDIESQGNRRRSDIAWTQALRLMIPRLMAGVLRGSEPLLVVSHAPPEGVGDGDDAYHRGFPGYRLLLDRLQPPLWLHGHTTVASVDQLVVECGRSTVINVTGAVLVEIRPPAADPAHR